METEPEPEQLGDYEAEIVSYEDGPTECTIYPADVGHRTRRTTWMTALDGSYCSLEDVR